MSLRAPAAGIILEVHGKEGEKVGTDKLLVNMSDLTRFKIRSTMQDDFRDLIKTGRKAYILVDDQKLEGRIGTISPALKDDLIQFYVRPIDNANPNLIPNQKVSLQIIRSSKSNVLRIRKGEAFSKDKQQDVFSVQNASATRKSVQFGLITDQYLEIKSGVAEGELLITSSTSPFRHLTHVEIKNQ
jgi:HlyD family secretion protein